MHSLALCLVDFAVHSRFLPALTRFDTVLSLR